ncbi:unnamed protein product [Didymodactylos carnosus]|uniref:Uncharacterized protein n=1 Tax=Didymodactylos carnosus TaxID=1234261 RepID=A0A815YZ19_9BILA|nr:unnamed protein product [Didymodactylos carnosus]CAF1576791.1 unnamed protein product [Didymodactylos carnosus]CAF4280217.1 unnamed protein product [Didymodactylos carnosus]CAF4442175.1 unnamed protein product [Didymodactylos carnosus]
MEILLCCVECLRSAAENRPRETTSSPLLSSKTRILQANNKEFAMDLEKLVLRVFELSQTYSDITHYLKENLSAIYKNEQFNIIIGKDRFSYAIGIEIAPYMAIVSYKQYVILAYSIRQSPYAGNVLDNHQTNTETKIERLK